MNGQNTLYLYNGPDIVAEYVDGWAKPTAINLHGAGTDDPIALLPEAYQSSDPAQGRRG